MFPENRLCNREELDPGISTDSSSGLADIEVLRQQVSVSLPDGGFNHLLGHRFVPKVRLKQKYTIKSLFSPSLQVPFRPFPLP